MSATSNRSQCAAEHAGLTGCQAPRRWVIRSGIGRIEAGACSRHLARVCAQVIRDAKRGSYLQLAVNAVAS
jgi:hypothetical protein